MYKLTLAIIWQHIISMHQILNANLTEFFSSSFGGDGHMNIDTTPKKNRHWSLNPHRTTLGHVGVSEVHEVKGIVSKHR